MNIIVNRVDDYISGSYNGVQFGVKFNQDKYDAMLALQEKASEASTMDELKAIFEEFAPLAEEDYSTHVETESPYIKVNKKTNKFHLQYKGVISSKVIPDVLAKKIIAAVEKNLDITPLVKCWVRFLRNPFFTDEKARLFAEYISAPYVNDVKVSEYMAQGFSHDVASKRATTTQVAISKEGLLVCYKVSAEVREKFILDENEEVKTRSLYKPTIDEITGTITYAEPAAVEERYYKPAVMGDRGDAFYCVPGVRNFDPAVDKPGHLIKVGCLVSLPDWSGVDTRDRVSGVKGLHVGGLSYIKGYQQDQTVTHNILVDPMHIGAIVGLGSGNDGAMRVRQYFVFGNFQGVNKNIYHSSKYGELTDQEYAKMVQESVEATKMTTEEAAKLFAEKEVLM